MDCVHDSLRPIREKLVSGKIDSKKHARLRGKISSLVNSRVEAFYTIANEAASKLVTSLHSEVSTTAKYREALKHALWSISDCARYVGNLERARASADLARFLDPDDEQTHVKFAGLAFHGTHVLEGLDLEVMFNYCVELGASTPQNSHVALKKLKWFVEYVGDERGRVGKSRRGQSPKYRFSCAFISLAWAVVVEDEMLALSRRVEAESLQLWEELRACLAHSEGRSAELTDDDLYHVVGAVICILHFVSPPPEEELPLPPKRVLIANGLFRDLVIVLCDQVVREFRNLSAAFRSRKRNRNRSMQKKNKRASLPPKTPDSERVLEASVRLDCCSTAFEKERPSAALGVLSFFAHFWSKTLLISPECDLEQFKDLLDHVKAARTAIDNFVSGGSLTPVVGVAMTAVVEARKGEGMLPQLPEDVAFGVLRCCRSRDMFGRIQEQSVNVQTMLHATEGRVMVHSAIRALEACPYSVQVRKIAKRHLDAFAARLFHGEPSLGMTTSATKTLDCRGLGDLVGIALRSQRLWRIEKKLIDFGGGRIARFVRGSGSSAGQSARQRSSPDPRLIDGEQIHGVNDRGDMLAGGKRTFEEAVARDVGMDGTEEFGCESLIPHKRRRLAAALSHSTGICKESGRNGSPSNLTGMGSYSPVVARTPARLASTRRLAGNGDEMGTRATPVRTLAIGGGTPLHLGQRTSDADADTPVASGLGFSRNPIASDEPPSLHRAVDAVFYGRPRSSPPSTNGVTWPWWRQRAVSDGDIVFCPLWTTRNAR